MPLKSGSSQAAISANIKTERAAGRPEKQAIAIAESKARDADSPMQKGHNDGRSGKSSNPPKKKADADEYMKGYNVGAWERRNEVANRPRSGDTTLEADDEDCSLELDSCDATLEADDEDCSLDSVSEEELAAAIKAGEAELAHQRKALKALPDRLAAKDSRQIALDRAAHRVDSDGHLHIDGANISKAMICPYLGSEIPNSAELGLDPSRVYMLYRDAAELEAAASTYENKPLMADHVAVSAEQPYKQYQAGTLSNVRFQFPYLKADVAVWNAEDISKIQDGSRAEISCGYRYRADMSPGQFEGQKYDGVMRELGCNHVALVEAGRCGSDVTAAA